MLEVEVSTVVTMAIEGSKGKGQASRSLAKDFHRLMKNITSMSGGQARLVGWDETDLKKGISVSIIPDSGLYQDGEFIFSIYCGSRYPEHAPEVNCKTSIYHPNIDAVEGNGDICLNMLDDDYWTNSMTLEDVVQGILFLLHNPNLEDPLSVLIGPNMEEEEFAENVRCSLEGGDVDGYHFERNRVLRGESGAKTADKGGVKEDEVAITDRDEEKNAGNGGKTKEGGVVVTDKGGAQESGDAQAEEEGAKPQSEVVNTEVVCCS